MSDAGNWCLIESDPGVFTELIHKFGVTGLQVVDTLPVSLDGCPDTWNVTSRDSGDTIAASDSWWLHLELYEVSYMWYSGLACCIVVVLGSCLSLVPGLQQDHHPAQDLLVPFMEASNIIIY